MNTINEDKVDNLRDNEPMRDGLEASLVLSDDLSLRPSDTKYSLSRRLNKITENWFAVVGQGAPTLEISTCTAATGLYDQSGQEITGAVFAFDHAFSTWLRLEVRMKPEEIISLRPNQLSFKLTPAGLHERKIDKISIILRSELAGKRVDPQTVMVFDEDFRLESRTQRFELDLSESEQRALIAIAEILRTDNVRSLHFGFTFRNNVEPFKFGDVRLERVRQGFGQSLAAADVASSLKTMTDQELVNFAQLFHNKILTDRIRSSFLDRKWGRVHALIEAFLPRSSAVERLLTMIGRACLYEKDHAQAISVLSLAVSLYPRSVDIRFYYGIAQLRAEIFEDAVGTLRSALEMAPDDKRIKRELGNALRRDGRNSSDAAVKRAKEAEAIKYLSDSLEADFTVSRAITLARLLLDHRRYVECLALVEKAIEAGDEQVAALVIMSRALVGLGQNSAALRTSERILEIEPANQAARYNLRVLKFLADEEPYVKPSLGDLADVSKDAASVEGDAARAALQQQLVDDRHDWLTLPGKPRLTELGDAEREELEGVLSSLSGFQLYNSATGTKLNLWRRDALLNLFESGLVDVEKPWSAIRSFESVYAGERRPLPARPSVVLLSRHGSFKFGGGEHFLAAMAEHYRSIGHEPIIVGTRPEFLGETGMADGARFAFVEGTAAALRRFILSEDVRLVHVLSGLGFQVAEALNFTNIPFVYGVHFWREVLGASDHSEFFDADGSPVPRAEFAFILSRAAMVYANSEFTRDVLEKAYGVRCPVVYSVPSDVVPGALS